VPLSTPLLPTEYRDTCCHCPACRGPNRKDSLTEEYSALMLTLCRHLVLKQFSQMGDAGYTVSAVQQ
jgi:hypothetical protein